MADARHFGKIMRRQDSFEKHCNDKTKRCGIERFQDNFGHCPSVAKFWPLMFWTSCYKMKMYVDFLGILW
jgi:hypothetical protein